MLRPPPLLRSVRRCAQGPLPVRPYALRDGFHAGQRNQEFDTEKEPMTLKQVWTLLGITALCTISALAQSQSPRNALRHYVGTSKTVSELDWNLLQFNLSWHDSYGSGEYVKSSPVWFDQRTMTFKSVLRVADQRHYSDPEPFFSLPAVRQRAVLQEVADNLVKLLGEYFPKVEGIDRYVVVTFRYYESVGGSSTVGIYDKGRLELVAK